MGDSWHFKSARGVQGPMSFAALQELVRNGDVQRTDTVRSDSQSPWRFADSIPHLFPPRNATHAASSTEIDSTCAKSELWYYKLDDREHGPIPIEELKSLAAVSGETANEIVVRSGRSGEWIALGSLAGEYAVPEGDRPPHSTPSLDTPERATSPASRFRARPRTAMTVGRLAWLRRNLDLLAAAVLFVAINAILLAMSQPRNSEERRYLEILRGLHQEIGQLQRRGATAAEWQELRLRSERKLQPVLADLERTASATNPIRQHLLWAGRDHLLEMLSQAAPTPTTTTDDDTAAFEQHLDWVEARLNESGQ